MNRQNEGDTSEERKVTFIDIAIHVRHPGTWLPYYAASTQPHPATNIP